MEANRKRLTSIIKTIIFCGHNNFSLRGHRDDGILDTESSITGKEGIFRSLLAFRIDSRDNILKDHMKSCGKSSTMISKIVQNEIINVLHQVITDSIVKNIKKKIFFFQLFAMKRQMSVLKNNYHFLLGMFSFIGTIIIFILKY